MYRPYFDVLILQFYLQRNLEPKIMLSLDIHYHHYIYLHTLTLWPPTPPVLHSVRLPAATRRSQLPGLGSEARTAVWRYTGQKGNYVWRRNM